MPWMLVTTEAERFNEAYEIMQKWKTQVKKSWTKKNSGKIKKLIWLPLYECFILLFVCFFLYCV